MTVSASILSTTCFMLSVSCVSEMLPRWFLNEDIPYDSMWPDDRLWYPKMLSKRYFNGYLKFEGMNKMLEYSFTDTTPNESS